MEARIRDTTQRHRKKSRVSQEQSLGLADPVTRQRSLIAAWLWAGGVAQRHPSLCAPQAEPPGAALGTAALGHRPLWGQPSAPPCQVLHSGQELKCFCPCFPSPPRVLGAGCARSGESSGTNQAHPFEGPLKDSADVTCSPLPLDRSCLPAPL